MTVTVASFRKDFAPTFGNASQYPDDVIQYWISMAQLMLGINTGAPPSVCSFTGQAGNPPATSNVLTVTAIAFGSLSMIPLLLEGANVPSTLAIVEQLTGNPGDVGTYQLNQVAAIAAENMVAIRGGTTVGSNPFWGPSSLTADSPPTTIADFAIEMWVAHQIVLEKQAMAAAAAGGDPGTKIGVISNKSVNGVSVGFDVGAITGDSAGKSAGYYNQTIYGMRFWRLARARSAGPIQIGIGRNPPFFMGFNNFGFLGASNAWAGPWPGISQGDTGFGG